VARSGSNHPYSPGPQYNAARRGNNDACEKADNISTGNCRLPLTPRCRKFQGQCQDAPDGCGCGGFYAADFICRFTNIGHFVSSNPVEDNRA
jgi:hypothetical protein